jgi:hypothetical protein
MKKIIPEMITHPSPPPKSQTNDGNPAKSAVTSKTVDGTTMPLTARVVLFAARIDS